MPSYRYRTGLLLGPWRASEREAREDAVRAGLASWTGPARDEVEWRFPGAIEARADEPQPPPSQE